ncbi:chitinase [Saccharopolyspora rosea]|uniref:chitinase n=1 Tax=Saccharopolyspora rosea TaxID=524884 RepID=UPI0021DB20F5|nr:chitinase [Saccharopolyspora rosea]
MRKVRKNLLTWAGAGAAAAFAVALGAAPALSAPAHSSPDAAASPVAASPYLYLGWGNPPKPSEVMKATGVKDFTLAFVLADGSCNPSWDGTRPLDADKAAIEEIRSAGGDVIPSVGGYNGSKLGEVCQDAQSLAGAYQKVLDAYQLKAIDIDIEANEFENDASQQRVLEALKILKEKNPGVRTVVTFPTLNTGPNDVGKRLIAKAKEVGADVDVWTQMPFDFGGNDMAQDTIKATEALKDLLKSTFGYSDADAYAHTGISSMNGKTDQSETVDQAAFGKIADYAKQKGLGRLSFWSVNRDRSCQGGGAASDSCSGIDQQPWEFTKIVAGFAG